MQANKLKPWHKLHANQHDNKWKSNHIMSKKKKIIQCKENKVQHLNQANSLKLKEQKKEPSRIL